MPNAENKTVKLSEQRKNKISGIITTILVHLAILALLIIFGFSTTLPLPGEEGVEVSLGSSNTGFGEIQPEKPAEAEKKATPPPPKEVVKENIVTQDTEEAPAVETVKKEVIKEFPVEKVPEEVVEEPVKEPEVNPAALYKGKSTTKTQAPSEGNTSGEGDMGKPGGSIDSKNYLGKGGFGDGPSYDLGGRQHRKLAIPGKQFSENATVVVQIYVDRGGKVIKAVAIDKGSTTTSASLRRLAENAAISSVFQAKPDAAEVQRGTITYHFVVRQ